MRFKFEELRVSASIMDMIDTVYELTASFPTEERYALTSQIRRAAHSIYLNLAEGSARRSYKDFARFLSMALGSLMEVRACSNIALRRNYISKDQHPQLGSQLHQIRISLTALRSSLYERLEK